MTANSRSDTGRRIQVLAIVDREPPTLTLLSLVRKEAKDLECSTPNDRARSYPYAYGPLTPPRLACLPLCADTGIRESPYSTLLVWLFHFGRRASQASKARMLPIIYRIWALPCRHPRGRDELR